ncbi:MAG: hypothetical protein HQ541_07775 [Mariniphaga sp.]|nr:hypothetical protein [Mariniphaga sp.]
MKKFVIPLFLIVFFAGTSCENKIDIEKEKEAIMAVILKEGDAHAAHDLKGLYAVHIQDSLVTRLQTRKNNYSIYAGWDEIKSLFESWTKMDMTKYENIKNSKENVILKVLDDCAWLICDSNWEYVKEGNPIRESDIQITFLEKIEGEWKISFNAIVIKSGPERE